MRSEIERSIHLVLNNQVAFQQIVNISTSATLATQKPSTDAPVWPGAKNLCHCGHQMVELTNPVIYGVSTNVNGYGYSILRCGAPLKLDGRYNETEESSSPPSWKTLAASCGGMTAVNKPQQLPEPKLFTSAGFTPILSVQNQPYASKPIPASSW